MNKFTKAPVPAQLNITLDKTNEVKCTCGGEIFVQGSMFRQLSKILAGTDKDAIIPIPVYFCSKCNEPLDLLMPEDLKKPKISLS